MRVEGCPLTVRQLLAYELIEEHGDRRTVATILGITPHGVGELLQNGHIAVGAATIEEGRQVLIEHDWLTARDALPPAAFAYLRAFEAYLQAPRDQRDHMLVRALCDAALAELVDPTS